MCMVLDLNVCEHLLPHSLEAAAADCNPGRPQNKMARSIEWEIAKPILEKDILEGRVPGTMEAKDVRALRPEYQGVKAENFKTNLKALRARLKKNKITSSWELAELRKDQGNHPRPDTNCRGEPQWDKSDAQRLLRQDVSEGKHLEMKPQQLYNTRNEYKMFTLKTFGEHVPQEVRHVKFGNWVEWKRNDDMNKKKDMLAKKKQKQAKQAEKEAAQKAKAEAKKQRLAQAEKKRQEALAKKKEILAKKEAARKAKAEKQQEMLVRKEVREAAKKAKAEAKEATAAAKKARAEANKH